MTTTESETITTASDAEILDAQEGKTESFAQRFKREALTNLSAVKTELAKAIRRRDEANRDVKRLRQDLSDAEKVLRSLTPRAGRTSASK